MPVGSDSDNKQLYDTMLGSTNQMAIIAGSFETNGTSEVTNVRGDGFTAEYVSAGVYRITFSQTWSAAQLISFVPSWEDDAGGSADDTLVSSEPFDDSDNSIDIRCAVNSVVTADDGPRVNFIAVFQTNLILATTHT